MPVTTADKRDTFRKMHESGCFILPNPWDVGSARTLQLLGFKALASTSAGFAWSIGKADNHVTLDDVLRHLTALCGAVDLPVNADFEGGFAREPDQVAANVARAVKTGVAGLSIEDSTGDAAKPLYERALRDRAHQGGAGCDRCRQQRRPADGPLRGFPGRARRSRHGDLSAQGLFGSRRGLPLCAGHQDQGANIGDREGHASQAGQSPDRRRPAFRSQRSKRWAFAASALAARWRVPRGPASCVRRARWRSRGHSPNSARPSRGELNKLFS